MRIETWTHYYGGSEPPRYFANVVATSASEALSLPVGVWVMAEGKTQLQALEVAREAIRVVMQNALNHKLVDPDVRNTLANDVGVFL